MAEIKLGDQTVHTAGTLPSKGSKAPNFTLVDSQLKEVELAQFKGKKVVLNIFPSIDTNVCAASVRAFNAKLSKTGKAEVLNISKDLPFAGKRFCAAEGLEGVHTLSDFRNPAFADAYGVTMLDGALQGLMSRAVVVVDEAGTVVHSEQVPSISQEPNYEAVEATL